MRATGKARSAGSSLALGIGRASAATGGAAAWACGVAEEDVLEEEEEDVSAATLPPPTPSCEEGSALSDTLDTLC